jgi:hypothetical protein
VHENAAFLQFSLDELHRSLHVARSEAVVGLKIA